MKILILGNGWIGKILQKYLNADMSVGDIEQLHKTTIRKYDVVINTAAKTQIDWCEKNKYESLRVNALLSRRIAQICHDENVKYVFFSSACIFESKDSNDWKDETSYPNPGCFYSFTKAVAEWLILEVNPDALIVRPRLPISEVPHERNSLTKILKYPKLHDNQESITVVEDMLPVLKSLIEEDKKGIFHLVNEGTISPIDMRGALALGGDYKLFKKEDEIKMMQADNRPRRVTTLVRNTKTTKLPDIQTRIHSIASMYKSLL